MAKPATEQEPVRVEDLSWRYKRPQVWYDHWRQRDRICRYVGDCVVCGTKTFSFDDGENDPRGALGDHAASPLIAEEHDKVGPDVPLCFPHANDYDSYMWAERIAARRWKDQG